MFPVCSTAAPSSHSPLIFSHSGTGIKALPPFSLSGKDVGFFRPIQQQLSFTPPQLSNFLYSNNHTIQTPHSIHHPYSLHNNYDTNDIQLFFTTNHSMETNDNACLVFTQNVSDQIPPTPPTNFTVDAAVDITSNHSTSPPLNSLDASLTNLNTTITSFLDKEDQFFDNTTHAVTSQLEQTIQTVERAINDVVNGLSSNADQTVELAGTRFAGFSVDFRDAITKLGALSLDLLRQTIIILEYYIATALKYLPYYYDNAKELLPPPVRDVLNLTQAKVTEILSPVATLFTQVYIVIEALERSLGLDPNDPIVPFLFFIGASATLGTFYWQSAYGGYSGDLSPQSTLEMLTGEKDVVLVDIRPEGLRERDGVPDLRRGARFKYASISLPEIDGSVRKLMKKERDLNDTLVAAVIRNLKIVKDRSRVIVLDVDGTRSKSIARSLRKLGLKKPYLVQGGFQSWVKGGMRIKELKPETTFTVLNEEAEAILEDIKPTPLKVVGYGVGFIAASYALSEWEKTLQFVGVIGLGQTIYQRLASYESSEDFKQDVRVLLSPVRVGRMAFSWAAGKLEPNRIGLPTSPSSSDVQSRVLQAAAKHESQPSDSEESAQEFPVAAASENIDAVG